MKPVNRLLFAAAVILMVGTAASYVCAQTATGRALFAYPMKGQTLEQQNADRAACHDWAVAQTGFDPSFVYAAQQAGVPQRAISNVTRRMVTPRRDRWSQGKRRGPPQRRDPQLPADSHHVRLPKPNCSRWRATLLRPDSGHCPHPVL